MEGGDRGTGDRAEARLRGDRGGVEGRGPGRPPGSSRRTAGQAAQGVLCAEPADPPLHQSRPDTSPQQSRPDPPLQ